MWSPSPEKRGADTGLGKADGEQASGDGAQLLQCLGDLALCLDESLSGTITGWRCPRPQR